MTKDRTPAGGDASNITYYNANGEILPDATGAVGAEIREYAQGVMVRRTYTELRDPATPPHWNDPGQVVTEPDAWDFSKATWDVFSEDDGVYRIVTALPDLFKALGLDIAAVEVQRAELLNLMTLPAWAAAPADLRADAAHWLATN